MNLHCHNQETCDLKGRLFKVLQKIKERVQVILFERSNVILQHSFQVNSDSSRAVTCMALSGLGVWISLQNSAVIRLFHAMSYESLCEVNVAPAVSKMLASEYTLQLGRAV